MLHKLFKVLAYDQNHHLRSAQIVAGK